VTRPLSCGSVMVRTGEQLEKRRRYNREYMRKWRTDPVHRKRECQYRLRHSLLRKVKLLPVTRSGATKRCAFCKQRQPITTVHRLAPSPRGFLSIYLVYCGQC
jgi:hypothetical protein